MLTCLASLSKLYFSHVSFSLEVKVKKKNQKKNLVKREKKSTGRGRFTNKIHLSSRGQG
jgi:hypothetical protein